MALFDMHLLFLCALDTETAPTFALKLDEEQLAEVEKERKLVCKRCGKFITYSDEAIQVHGAHQHTRINPHGLEFTFGCFRTAQGCGHIGELTDRYTWFNDYSWCVANCANCQEHLGWRFQNQEHHFHGLILARITHPKP